MPETLPLFFVPGATPEDQEAVFAELARFAGRTAPQLSARVYSITFDHDGEEWRATVGETLSGVRSKWIRSKGTIVERETPLRDAALVLAIFSGAPYLVVTDSRPIGRVRSAFQNPFRAGAPKPVTRFSSS